MQDDIHSALIDLQQRALAVDRPDLAEHAEAAWHIVARLTEAVEAEEARRRASGRGRAGGASWAG